MRILLLCHIEDAWAYAFDHAYLGRVRAACAEHDVVIHLTSRNGPLDRGELMDELEDVVHAQWDWGYGYQPHDFIQDRERAWLIPGKYGHDEWVWVPSGLRDADYWRQHEVTIAGGFRDLCLGNLETVLAHQGIPYTVRESCVYPEPGFDD